MAVDERFVTSVRVIVVDAKRVLLDDGPDKIETYALIPSTSWIEERVCEEERAGNDHCAKACAGSQEGPCLAAVGRGRFISGEAQSRDPGRRAGPR